MGISLRKGENTSLSKQVAGLQEIDVGLGWDARATSGIDFDLDAYAFLLEASGRVGRDEHFVFYNNRVSPCASVVLTEAQKYCILINLLDSLLSDGSADPAEQALFGRFLAGWGISETALEPAFKVIVTKNDKSIFSQKSHPKNSQRVNLTKR
jgi:hypothetical protein